MKLFLKNYPFGEAIPELLAATKCLLIYSLKILRTMHIHSILYQRHVTICGATLQAAK